MYNFQPIYLAYLTVVLYLLPLLFVEIYLLHGTEEDSLFGLIVVFLCFFFFKEINIMLLHGLSVHSAASSSSHGDF